MFPFEYSKITHTILMGTTPRPQDYILLKKVGVTLVVNMRADKKAYSNVIPVVQVPTLDSRFFPIKPHKLNKAVKLSQQALKNNGKVYIFCRGGRHRSLVMCAAILVSQGLTAKEAMELIKKQRTAADPEAKHIKKATIKFEDWWLNERQLI